MIYTLDITVPSRTPVPWLHTVDALAKPRGFEFKPGLNVLWGRNGAGKTTLTKLLARLFHCEQSGRPVVTQESVCELRTTDGVTVTHDGQGVRHFDPSHAAGLADGAFDYDFIAEGVANAMFKGSAGLTTLHRFDDVFNAVVCGDVPGVEWKVKSNPSVESFLKANAEPGQPTILLDEPERSLDINAQIGIWRFLRAYASDVQFIVASHSLLALGIPDAHYIDLSPGYREKATIVFKLLPVWPTEAPTKVPADVVEKIRTRRKAAL